MKYFLITIQSFTGPWRHTFVQKGKTTYDAFLTQVKQQKGKNGFIYSYDHSILFSEECTEDDYKSYCSLQKQS